METVLLNRELKNDLLRKVVKSYVIGLSNFPNKQFTDVDSINLKADQCNLVILQFVGKTRCPEGMYVYPIMLMDEVDKNKLEPLRAKYGCGNIYHTPFQLEGQFRGKHIDLTKDKKLTEQTEQRLIDSINDLSDRMRLKEEHINNIIVGKNFYSQKYLDATKELEQLREDKRKLHELLTKMF